MSLEKAKHGGLEQFKRSEMITFPIALIIPCFNRTFTGPFESSSYLLWPMVVADMMVKIAMTRNSRGRYDGGDCDDMKQSGSISALGRINARLVHIRKSNSSSSINSNDTNSEHKSKNVLD